MAKRLRFGIMCRGPFLSRWEAACVERILALPDAPELALLIVEKPPAQPQPGPESVVGKLRTIGFNRLLFYAYKRRRFRPALIETVPMGSWAEGIPTIELAPRLEGKHSQVFADADVAQVREHDLDFILRFAFNIIRGGILEAARFGVWSFHHGDESRYRGSPAAFWEIANGDDVTGAMLQRLTDRLDAGIILKKGHYPTSKLSHSRNLDNLLGESAHWPAEVCSDIAHGIADYLSAAPCDTTAPVYRAPTNLPMLRFARRQLRNGVAVRIADWAIRDRWAIGIADAPIHRFLEPGFRPRITYLQHPVRSSFYADPFALRRGGETLLMVEEFSYLDKLGKLTALAADGSAPAPVPQEFPVECHLSYPYLIEHQGEVFCVPETHQANEIALYRAVGRTGRWEKVQTLVAGFPGVDATVIEHAGSWWMFCTREDRQPHANLYLFFADDLMGPWQVQPGSPVKRDARSSRPAGTPFVHEGRLYRPAQDCSRTYGGRIAINEVECLTRRAFRERPVAHVEPPLGRPFRDGIHTLSAFGDKTLLDGKRAIFLPQAIPQRLRERRNIPARG